jgi:hypothetical protein
LLENPLALSRDVGVDTHDYSPWNFEEVRKIMEAKATVKEESSRAEASSCSAVT